MLDQSNKDNNKNYIKVVEQQPPSGKGAYASTRVGSALRYLALGYHQISSLVHVN